MAVPYEEDLNTFLPLRKVPLGKEMGDVSSDMLLFNLITFLIKGGGRTWRKKP